MTGTHHAIGECPDSCFPHGRMPFFKSDIGRAISSQCGDREFKDTRKSQRDGHVANVSLV
jgi:hypothetical protein